MYINHENVDLIEFPYVHDAIFDGFRYDYDSKKIYLSLCHPYLKKTINCELNDVLFFEFQGCSFWGGGNAIYYASCYKEHDFLQRVQERVRVETTEHPSWDNIDENIHYIVFELIVNSGDVLLVACESVDCQNAG